MLKRISLCVTSSLALACAPAAHAHIVDNVLEHSAPNAALQLAPIGSHESGVLGKSSAEIVAYHAASQRILTVNARSGEIDILDGSDPTQPQKIGAISAGGDKEINSVAVRPDGLAVAALQQADKTDNGEALFFNAATGQELGRVGVGALPDNVHLTADGRHALIANEGEPSDALNAEGTAYLKDPEGSISVISLPTDVAKRRRLATSTRPTSPPLTPPTSTLPSASSAPPSTTTCPRGTSSRNTSPPRAARPMPRCRKITPSRSLISSPPP